MSPNFQKNILVIEGEREAFVNNYGLILKQLRQINGYTLKTAAQMVGKSVGWFSEAENCRG